MDAIKKEVALQHIETFLLEEQEATAEQILAWLEGLDVTLEEVEALLRQEPQFAAREENGVILWSDEGGL